MPRGKKMAVTPKTIGSQLTLEFLRRENMTQSFFAQICHIRRSALNEYLRGTARPSLADAIAIQDTTGHEVPARTWLIDITKGADSSDASRADPVTPTPKRVKRPPQLKLSNQESSRLTNKS